MRTADHVLFTLVGSKGTPNGTLSCAQLHKKAERVACTLVERGRVNSGDHVALVYPPGLDLVCAFYGCLYVGTLAIHRASIYLTLFYRYLYSVIQQILNWGMSGLDF